MIGRLKSDVGGQAPVGDLSAATVTASSSAILHVATIADHRSMATRTGYSHLWAVGGSQTRLAGHQLELLNGRPSGHALKVSLARHWRLLPEWQLLGSLAMNRLSAVELALVQARDLS